MTSSDEETLRFIAASFPSVWALELLFLLKRFGGKCSEEELVTKLLASETVVSKALDALTAAGLVSVEDGEAIHVPANSGVAACVERAEALYRCRPNAVCRAIVAAQTGSATAFADAFRLRRDSNG